MLDKGVYPDVKIRGTRETALTAALGRSHFDLARHLISREASVENIDHTWVMETAIDAGDANRLRALFQLGVGYSEKCRAAGGAGDDCKRLNYAREYAVETGNNFMAAVIERDGMGREVTVASNSSSGGGMDDGLAILGLGAALGVGVGAAISGDLDMGSVSEAARALAGSGGSPMGGTIAGSGTSGGPSTGASSTAAASGTQAFAIDQQYRPTCPGGRQASRTIPIKTNSAACAQAMRTYARAASCNLYEEQQTAERAYYSACASEIYK